MVTIATAPERRDTKLAVKRGLRLRCPCCGESKLFSRYLKVVDRCAACGEELHHHRADDGPAYLTILVVVHVVGVTLHFLVRPLQDTPLLLALLLCAEATVLSLLLLPRMKGFMVAIQWAKEMHGFGPAELADGRDD